MIKRLPVHLKANPEKVIMQFFNPGSHARYKRILERTLLLDADSVNKLLDDIYKRYSRRHKRFEQLLERHFACIPDELHNGTRMTREQRLLIGAYFSKEYSVQSAALFNPSMVPHPDQSGLNNGEVKFILSLRSTGESHISSLSFREGFIGKDGEVKLLPESRFTALPEIKRLVKSTVSGLDDETAAANYDVVFNSEDSLSELNLFPSAPTESNGIEDVRFVRFIQEDGAVVYYGTYTAYNGHRIQSQLIQTTDFREFGIRTLHGPAIADKGMALFPRKVNGKYMMVSRKDAENLYIMQSDDLYVWNDVQPLYQPRSSWEFVQVGNCGSPIETAEGWLLITHSVGTFREYVISAILLDKDNPGKVIGTLPQPLITPEESEREGYVPNVVYSCGSMLHNEIIYIPYAMSDSSSGLACVPVSDLLTAIVRK